MTTVNVNVSDTCVHYGHLCTGRTMRCLCGQFIQSTEARPNPTKTSRRPFAIFNAATTITTTTTTTTIAMSMATITTTHKQSNKLHRFWPTFLFSLAFSLFCSISLTLCMCMCDCVCVCGCVCV